MTIVTLVLGLPVLLASWLATLTNWRRGMTLLLLFLPFAGGIALFLRPNPVGPLLKDLLFVLPTYGAALLFGLRDLRLVRVPTQLTVLLTAFAALVIMQVFNPSLQNIVVGAVGVKVWLLYIPLLYLGGALFETAGQLVRFLRLVVIVSMIPCVLGIVQFLMSAAIGYKATMTMFYGTRAFDATQGFASFIMGAEFFRIPSTFSFVTQYSGHTLVTIVLVYMLRSIDPDPTWRTVSRALLTVALVAAFLSGARANFLFAPFLLLTILFLDARLTRMAAGLIFGPLIMVTTLQAVGLDVLQVVGRTSGLVQQYGTDLVFPQLVESMVNHPLGSGAGMNTGPALNVLPAAAKANLVFLEGYYSKTVVELGIPGLLLVLMIFGSLIWYGFRVHRRLQHPAARSCSAAILGFLIIMTMHSFKGWQVDLDPINVWFWVFAGVMFSLPRLPFHQLTAARAGSARPRWTRRRTMPDRAPAFRR